MSLKDKMRAQATQLAKMAQDAGKAGQSKLEDVQARRKFDATLREFGAAVYADRTGPSTDATRAEVERLFGELTTMEAELDAAPDDDASPEDASHDDGSPEGGFKL